jgi:hypothetical protein
MREERLVIRVMLATVGAAILVGAFVVTPARADGGGLGGFRCGGRIVRNGETQDDVARKCGDPDAERTWTETHTEAVYEYGRKVERTVPIEYAEWKYDFGRDRLIRYLLFVQGRLRNVTTGEYGGK